MRMKREIYRLIEKARQGDRAALERLTAENTGLIWSAVKKFSGRGTDKEDLFQIGAIGLIKAINKFDTSFNVEFSTYAVPMIMGEIRRFLRDDGLIKVSRGLKETAVKAMAAAERISAGKGRDAVISEIAEAIDCDCATVALALESAQPPDSIYKTVGDGTNDLLLIDKLHSGENREEDVLNTLSLREAIKKLPERERRIMVLRYYREKTQSEVARIMGLSQVQISRLEKKSLGVLRENIV